MRIRMAPWRRTWVAAKTSGIVRTGDGSLAATGCTCVAGSHSAGWASWARPIQVALGWFHVE
jgi:hypothetical protein